MRRPPKAPPFKVGARVRYRGTRTVSMGATDGSGRWVEVLAPGIEVDITDVRPGRQGTGERVYVGDGLDDEMPAYDETRDGASVYEVDGRRRLITWGRRADWTRVVK